MKAVQSTLIIIAASLLQLVVVTNGVAAASTKNNIDITSDVDEHEQSLPKQSTKSKPSQKTRRSYSGKKIVTIDEDSISADSSEVMREDQKVMVTRTLFGIGKKGFINGFDLGLFLKPDLLLVAKVENVAGAPLYSDGPSSSYSFNTSKSEASAISIYAKKFWTNSFYTNLGLTQYDFNENSDAGIRQYKEHHLSLSIGNQWQWKYFTIGCDWYGRSIFLRQKVKINTVPGPPIEKTGDVRLLAFYLGFSL